MFYRALCNHPRNLLNVICIADTATYTLNKNICIGKYIDKCGKEILLESGFKKTVATGYFIPIENFVKENDYCSKGELFSALLSKLMLHMGFSDHSLHRIADYISSSVCPGGIGKLIYWNEINQIFSPNVLTTLVQFL